MLLGAGLFQVAQSWVSAEGEGSAGLGWTDDDPDGPDLVATLGDPRHSGQSAWPGRIDTETVAYDIDDDGTREIVVQGTDRYVYVLDPDSGRTVAKLGSRYPVGWQIDSVLNAVAIDRLAPGQPPTIVVANHAASITAWQFVPEDSTRTSFTFHKAWERRANDCFHDAGMDARPVLADLDQDGDLDMLLQTEEQGLFALTGDGELLWHHCWSGGNGSPVAADLDGDGQLEAIFGSDSGLLSVMNGRTGAPLWTFNVRDPAYGLRPGSIVSTPVVADLDGKAPLEVVFTARHAYSADVSEIPYQHMGVFAVHANASTGKAELLWMRQPDWAHPLSDTRLTIADIDGDGHVEIFGMDWNTIGHKPGNWERLGPAHVFRLDHNGNDVWVRTVDTWWSNKRILLSDSDGNGEMDILVNGPRGAHDGMWRLSAATGDKEGFFSTSPWKAMRGPVPLDLQGDGRMQVAFPVSPLEGDADRGAVLVYDLNVPFSA